MTAHALTRLRTMTVWELADRGRQEVLKRVDRLPSRSGPIGPASTARRDAGRRWRNPESALEALRTTLPRGFFAGLSEPGIERSARCTRRRRTARGRRGCHTASSTGASTCWDTGRCRSVTPSTGISIRSRLDARHSCTGAVSIRSTRRSSATARSCGSSIVINGSFTSHRRGP